jgi:hypothetical protein
VDAAVRVECADGDDEAVEGSRTAADGAEARSPTAEARSPMAEGVATVGEALVPRRSHGDHAEIAGGAVEKVHVNGADGTERVRLTWHMRRGQECRVRKE